MTNKELSNKELLEMIPKGRYELEGTGIYTLNGYGHNKFYAEIQRGCMCPKCKDTAFNGINELAEAIARVPELLEQNVEMLELLKRYAYGWPGYDTNKERDRLARDLINDMEATK